SVLAPFWYAGSWLIGLLAGSAGDGASLGFITETERQVESHLHEHLRRLPAADQRSRQILNAMAADEVAHAAKAEELGGEPLPEPIRRAMKWTARIMTRCSFWL
ncbi:MAG: demethoxyubiquinone hydroxylase family protein, partial [Proteobacteria bacterium]|nr:demethoxyubiquinone hydroxylase family protein [Pseudomonadota bacterium]